MISILLKFSVIMVNHIDGFKDHYNLHSRHEAIRVLLLKAFEAYGFPLADETVRFKRGRPPVDRTEYDIVGKQPEQAADFYTEQYKRKLGFFDNAKNVEDSN